MDIARLSMNLATNNIQSNVGIAMLDKSLDLSKETADTMVEMISAADMERSVHPNLGGSIDLYV